jgi:hypothetical protein
LPAAKKLDNIPFKPKIVEKKKAPAAAPKANLPPPGSDDELR